LRHRGAFAGHRSQKITPHTSSSPRCRSTPRDCQRSRGLGQRSAMPSSPPLQAPRYWKLAVQENILSKPGFRLTRKSLRNDEKSIPIVAIGEIGLASSLLTQDASHRRSNHEKMGRHRDYPMWIKREAIPIGARNSSAVGNFTHLASERPYRSAMTTERPLKRSCSEGASVDPRVVEGHGTPSISEWK